MNSAIRPPIMNQENEVAMYMTPSTLGSVVCRYCRNLAPRGARATGYGRVTTGRGATAVTVEPPAVRRTLRVVHMPRPCRDHRSLIRRGVEHCARGPRVSPDRGWAMPARCGHTERAGRSSERPALIGGAEGTRTPDP